MSGETIFGISMLIIMGVLISAYVVWTNPNKTLIDDDDSTLPSIDLETRVRNSRGA